MAAISEELDAAVTDVGVTAVFASREDTGLECRLVAVAVPAPMGAGHLIRLGGIGPDAVAVATAWAFEKNDPTVVGLGKDRLTHGIDGAMSKGLNTHAWSLLSGMARREKPPGQEKWTWEAIRVGHRLSKADKRMRRLAKHMGASERPDGQIQPPPFSENPAYYLLFILLFILMIVIALLSGR